MELNITTAGDSGPEVIILHGLLGSSRNWQSITRELSSDCRVIVPDLRNHGDSPHGPHSYELMRDDIIRLIEVNCERAPHLIGHSMGGVAAMEVAASGKAELASLIVVDAVPVRLGSGILKILDALSELDLESVSSRGDADEALSGKIPEAGVRKFVLQNLDRKDTGEYAWRCNLPELRRFAAEDSFDLSSAGVYEGPALVIAGGKSEYRLWEHEALLKAHFPAMKLEVVEDAGHWVHADAPEKFIKILRQWLNAQD